MVHFSKFRLSGFKSFVDPTEVEIGPGLNGIVGPNGCGKSNLVEAIRWVMGETSAKRIRGDGMEDVIFAGTGQRPARSAAEVSLLLDNQELDAPEPFQKVPEIQVSRRIERDKGSTYKVNGKTVRARDVQMLFADTVSGANSPALVSQGKITTIINAKPHERRHVLEESAGVAGLYTRRHEAELRLKAAEQNLARVNDGLNAMRTQLNTLKRQSGQAAKYKSLSDTIRALDMLLAADEWETTTVKQKAMREEFEGVDTKVAALLAELAKLNTEHEKHLSSIPEARQNDMKAQAALQAVRIEAERFEKDQAQAKQALIDAQEAVSRLDQQQAEHKSSLDETKASLLALAKEQEEIAANHADLPEKLTAKKELLDSTQQKIDRSEQKYQKLISELAQKKAEREKSEQEQEEIKARYETMLHRYEAIKEEYESVQTQAEELVDLDALKADLTKTEAQLTSLEKALKQLQSDHQQASDDYKAISDLLDQDEKALSILNAERKHLESYLNEQSKSEACDHDDSLLHHIDVQKGYEKALTRALGEQALQAIPQECDSVSAQSVWTSPSENYITQNDQQSALSKLSTLADYITSPFDAVQKHLKNFFIVDDIYSEGTNDLYNQLNAGQALITKTGDLWRADGLKISSEAPLAQAAFHIEYKNRLSEILGEEETLLTKVEKLQAEKETKHAALDSVQEQVNDTQQELQNTRHELSTTQRNYHDAEKQNAQYQTRLNLAQERLHNAKENFEEAKTQYDRCLQASRPNEASSDEAAMTQKDALRHDIDAMRDSLNAMRSDYDLLRFQDEQNQKRSLQLTQDKETLSQRSQRYSDTLVNLDTDLKKAKEKLESLSTLPEQANNGQQDFTARIDALEEQARKSSDHFSALENSRIEQAKVIRDQEHTLSQFKEKRAALSAGFDAVKQDIIRIKQDVEDRFQLSIEGLLQNVQSIKDKAEQQDAQNKTAKFTQASTQEMRDALIKFKHERDMMGAVNLRAEQEAEEVSQSIAELEQEMDDITQAITQLRQAIQKLNKEAREKIKIAYENVNAHFQTLFKRLFNGGQAHLEMIESDDPLEAGLEIYAQPPGKALQSLSLLSGGEQTLTATALIFAMFLTNPSPICVLDEIDAPLDDSNVDRVCDLLEHMAKSGETRFLVITHHRMTMARMDRLYGVTMSEKGVSKLVSVDLAQEETLFDRLMA